MVKVSTSISGFRAGENVLIKAPELVSRETRKALRRAGAVVVRRAKQLVPPPGYPGDKPELKPLRDTIGVEVKQGRRALYAVVGPKRPAGSHGHLVEGTTSVRHFARGKPTGVILKKTPFLEPASKQTFSKQREAISKILRTVDEQLGRLLR